MQRACLTARAPAVTELVLGESWQPMQRRVRKLTRPHSYLQVLASGEGQLEDTGADPAWRRDTRERDVGKLRNQLGEISFTQAWAEGRKLAADKAVSLVLDFLG